ncbi:MAG: hypothetical protein MI975_27455 [Cytophagales bacterium]|nr:hypothetical protein [Cytophagales bacterium]
MKAIVFTILFFSGYAIDMDKKGENVRYILIEAPCKSGFNALPENQEKVLITKVFKKEFENAFEVVNAEQELIKAFEVAVEKAYPNQLNNVKDILVYMLNSEEEAKQLYGRKIALFKTLKTGVIELKMK